MIIGISGYAQSGKDTTGLILQYLTAQRNYLMPIDEFLKTDWIRNSVNAEWEIRKFAYKVKVVASKILNINIEKFEDIEFKNLKMSGDWLLYKVTYYVGNLSTFKLFSDPYEMNDFITKNGMVNNYIAEEIQPTYREFLQWLGTEAGRERIHPNIWVNALFADYTEVAGLAKDEDNISVQYLEGVYPNWIITDVRFPNEAEAIKKRGGIILRIERPNVERMLHRSETSLDNWDFDYTIKNDYNLDKLINSVTTFTKEIEINKYKTNNNESN